MTSLGRDEMNRARAQGWGASANGRWWRVSGSVGRGGTRVGLLGCYREAVFHPTMGRTPPGRP